MAAGNGIRKWRTQVSKSVKNGQKMPFFGIYGCLSGPWRGALVGKLIYT